MRTLSVSPIFLLVCTLAFGVSVVAGGPTWPTYAIDFSTCGSSSMMLYPEMLYAGLFAWSQTVLNATMEVTTTEVVTSGTYHVNITGGTTSNGTQWSHEYSGSLGSIVTLPITTSVDGLLNFEFPLKEGQNNFTVKAFDEDQEEILCFTFGYLVSSQQGKTKALEANNKMKKMSIIPRKVSHYKKKHTTEMNKKQSPAARTTHRRQRQSRAPHHQMRK